MQLCPVLFRVDFQREIARLVETDVRFGKAVLAHQEIDLQMSSKEDLSDSGGPNSPNRYKELALVVMV